MKKFIILLVAVAASILLTSCSEKETSNYNDVLYEIASLKEELKEKEEVIKNYRQTVINIDKTCIEARTALAKEKSKSKAKDLIIEELKLANQKQAENLSGTIAQLQGELDKKTRDYNVLYSSFSNQISLFTIELKSRDRGIMEKDTTIKKLLEEKESLMAKFSADNMFVDVVLKKTFKRSIYKKLKENEVVLNNATINSILFTMDEKKVKKLAKPFTLEEEKNQPILVVVEKIMRRN